MFSYPIERGLPPTDYPYDLVDTQRGSPQGRLFPSDLVEDHSFDSEGAYSTIKPWYSEGDLVTETTSRIGVNKTIEAFVAHRDRYWTDADLKLMSSKGINTVRLNVGWWAFHAYPLPETEVIVHDLCYFNKTFVTLSGPFLLGLL